MYSVIKYYFVIERQKLIYIYVNDAEGYVWGGNGLHVGTIELGSKSRGKEEGGRK